jgi:hypothetical protein
MTNRQWLLLDLVEYLAIGGGVYVGTKGRMPWIAALVPLALLVPFWIIRFLRWRKDNARADTPPLA